MKSKYYNEVIKLNQEQSEQKEVFLRFEKVKELVDLGKNIILVNQKDEQCLLTNDELMKGKEIKSTLKSIPVHNLFYEFKNNCNTLDHIDLLLLKRLHFTWYNKMVDYLRSDKFLDMLSFINGQRESKSILPAKEDVFKAYQSNFNGVRIVVLGQDVYPSKKAEPTGLAFASYIKNTERKPYALYQIEKALKEQMNYPPNMMLQNDLLHWQQQGIMLLNCGLTVEENYSGSHTPYWDEFIQLTIELLDDKKIPLIFILLGKPAQGFKKHINLLQHTVFEREHPSAGSYASPRRDWKSDDLFKEVSKLTQIKWI